jgi:hypothetical protein
MPRASQRRRREEVKDPALLHSSQPISNVSGELELLGFDGALETIAQLVHRAAILDLFTGMRLVATADVLRAAVNSAKQIAHAFLERIIAVRAAEAAGRPEIAERGRAECASRCVACMA